MRAIFHIVHIFLKMFKIENKQRFLNKESRKQYFPRGQKSQIKFYLSLFINFHLDLDAI